MAGREQRGLVSGEEGTLARREAGRKQRGLSGEEGTLGSREAGRKQRQTG